MSRPGLALLLLLLIGSRPGFCQPSPQPTPAVEERKERVLTLNEAIKKGIEYHPSVQRRREEALAEEAIVNRVASDGQPKLFIESVYKDGVAGQPNFSLPGISQSGSIRNWAADSILSWTYDFGKTRFRTRAQRHNASAARAEEQAQIAWTAIKVVRAYHGVLLAQAILQLESKNVEARATVARYAEIRFKAGTIARVDVGLAQASLAEARVREIRARNEVAQAYAALDNAIGVPPTGGRPGEPASPAGGATGSPTGGRPGELASPAGGAYRVEDPPVGPPEKTLPLEDDVRHALDRRPEMESVRQKVQGGEEAQRAAEAGHHPTLRFLASSGYLELPKRPIVVPDNYAFGVALTIPIWTGGGVEAESDESAHRLNALNHRAAEQANEIRLEVTRARLLVSSLVESRPAVEERCKQAADSERLATARYRHGLGTLVELQQAQLALLSAQIDEARLRYETYIAHYALRYVRGDILDDAGGTP